MKTFQEIEIGHNNSFTIHTTLMLSNKKNASDCNRLVPLSTAREMSA
jgi:hypothetical protein